MKIPAYSKTEKLAAILVSVLLLFVFYNIAAASSSTMPLALGDETSESSDSNDSKSESSSNESSESSSSDEESEKSKDEQSVNEQSVKSIEEKSTQEISEESVQSTDEESDGIEEGTSDEMSVVSEESVASEASVENIGDFDEVDFIEDDISIVTHGEKLFFIIPVEIEKEVTFDEEGNVKQVKQTLISRLLELFSF